MSDPRREPDSAGKAVVTGVRRKDVLQRLETLAPTPSKPPLDAPGGVLDYMLALAQMHRSDAAYAAARAEETGAELKVEVDEIKSQMLKLAGKVDRLEDRVNLVVNTQITQNSEIQSVKNGMVKMEGIFTDAIENVHSRVKLVEATQQRDREKFQERMDKFERSFGEFRELVMADVDVRRRQLAYEEAKNGDAPTTPKVKRDDSGDTEPE